MKIIVGKHSGFCKGVKCAVQMCESADVPAVTFGEIIHNEYVIEKLKQRGVKPIHSIDEIDAKNVIVRAHGIPKETFDLLSSMDLKIYDATCNFVKRTYEIVEKYSNLGYRIIIFGKSTHPEVIGIASRAKNKPIIISNIEDKIELKNNEKVCLVAQTTASSELYQKIISKIQKIDIKTLEVFDTICYTTSVRQNETRNLAKQSDLMVVVGSRTSSNTMELFKICKEFCSNVIYCQDISDIKDFNFTNFENIGIVAGASTPKELIKEVKLTMEEKNMDLQPEIAEDADNKAVASDNEISMEDIVAGLDKKKNFKRGQIIECTVECVDDEGLRCSIPNAKTEVLLPSDEVSLDGYDKSKFAVGDVLSVKVLSNAKKLLISMKAIEEQAKMDEEIKELLAKGEFEMTFNRFNKGGLSGRMGSFNVFVPGSQIRLGYVNQKDFEKYLNKSLKLRVIKSEGKDIVASARAILEEEKLAREDSFWNMISEAETVTGKVMRFAAFGAFVSVDGFDCLAHISDLSWSPIKSCDEILEVGKEYEFKLLKADRASNKVSLGYKQLQKRPIDVIAEKHPVGSIVKGKVTKLKSFGAFVEIEPGFEGLVHISQVSHTYVENIAHALEEGEEIDVMVISYDRDKNKCNLSIKALLPEPEKKEEQKRDQKPRRPRTPREPRSSEPVNWVSEESGGGISIGDLLKGQEE